MLVNNVWGPSHTIGIGDIRHKLLRVFTGIVYTYEPNDGRNSNGAWGTRDSAAVRIKVYLDLEVDGRLVAMIH